MARSTVAVIVTPTVVTVTPLKQPITPSTFTAIRVHTANITRWNAATYRLVAGVVTIAIIVLPALYALLNERLAESSAALSHAIGVLLALHTGPIAGAYAVGAVVVSVALLAASTRLVAVRRLFVAVRVGQASGASVVRLVASKAATTVTVARAGHARVVRRIAHTRNAVVVGHTLDAAICRTIAAKPFGAVLRAEAHNASVVRTASLVCRTITVGEAGHAPVLIDETARACGAGRIVTALHAAG